MIHYFNPGHETAVLNQSPYYMPPANVVTMQTELALLPAWYAQAGDGVWIDKNVDTDYIQNLQNILNFDMKIVNESNIKQHLRDIVYPWGISPQIIHFFEEINNQYEASLSIPKWHDKLIELNSRFKAKECLEYIIQNDSLISSNLLPNFYSSIEEIENLVRNSNAQFLAKAPYSSSGRGLLWLPIGELTRTERQILHGIIKKQGQVSIEKVLDKQLDFAMEFMSDGKGNITFKGYSLFTTNNKGGYMGNILASQQKIEVLITKHIERKHLFLMQNIITEYLSKECANIYTGCIGIDMMIYKEENGEFKLQPCIEINMRHNMGYLAIQLFENYIVNQSEGIFKIEFSPNEGEIYERHIQHLEKYPMVCHNKRIANGYLNLCPVNKNSKYWAYSLLE